MRKIFFSRSVSGERPDTRAIEIIARELLKF